MNREQESLETLFGLVGAAAGLVLAVVLLSCLHIRGERAEDLLPLCCVCFCGFAGYWFASKVNAGQFFRGFGLLLCAVGHHWWGPNYRKKLHGKTIPKRDRNVIGGLECWRCNFRPDDIKPRLPTQP